MKSKINITKIMFNMDNNLPTSPNEGSMFPKLITDILQKKGDDAGKAFSDLVDRVVDAMLKK